VGQELALNEYQTALDVAGAQSGAAYSRLEGSLRAGSLRSEAGFARFGGSAAASASLGQAGFLDFRASGARTAGMFRVGTTLLSGAGDTASPYLNMRYGRAPSRAGGYPSGSPTFG
jgi:hypothetical protein